MLNRDSHLCLVDASGYIYRAYHALPSLTRRSDGHPVGAVSGFCNMVWRFLSELREQDPAVTHLAAVFDKSEHSFRKDMDPRYKANRPPAPEDLVRQFPLVRDAARAFGLPVREAEGFEADDIIAACARAARDAGAVVTVVSSDKDLMQLVGEGVTMFDPMKNRTIGVAEVREKYGVDPERLTDVFALAGDSSDNIQGVKGIGLVTAAELIRRFCDLESLLAGADTITQPARRRNLIEQADEARLAYELVKLNTEAPTGDLAACALPDSPDYLRLISFLDDMEFRTLTRRVRDAASTAGTEIPAAGESPSEVWVDPGSYRSVTDAGTLKAWVSRARETGLIAIDTETDGLRSVDSPLTGISLAVAPGEACYVPLRHHPSELGQAETLDQMDSETAISVLRPLFADGSVLKIGHNLSFDISVLAGAGIGDIRPIDDTMSLSFVTAAGSHGHGLDELSRLHLGHEPISFGEVVGTGKKRIDFSAVPVDAATRYAAEEADIALRLWMKLKPSLARNSVSFVYENIERPLIPVIAAMERTGIMVDRARLCALSAEFAAQAKALEVEAHQAAGRAFNPASPRQIGEILFGDMGLPGGRKTPTGAWSTAVGTLEELAVQGHVIADIILRWRLLSKLKNTYADALVEAISPATGRVHTSFSLAGAQTGRLSSTDPNLQNIPVRTDEGRKIRSAFVAERGWRLVSADYSQIELRILAHIAGVEALKEVFASGGDVHAMTASEVFGVAHDQVDADMRRRAKTINFGIIYGISAFGLAGRLGVPRHEAASHIEAYFRRFPGIAEYMEASKAQARKRGYVETAFGRICRLPLIESNKPPERAFAERQAINAPIQGSAADIIKRAMVRMPTVLAEAGLRARMLLQVHDELLFEVPEDECEALMALASEAMSSAAAPVVELSVPLTVAVHSGADWTQAH